jgi:zinc protease
METEFTKLGAARVNEAELSARKAALVGAFGRNVETTAGVAGQLSGLALYGLPLDRLQTYVADIEGVTPGAVQAAAARYFDPSRADLVIVGDADAFYVALRRTRPSVERIAIDKLNLDRPELR